MADTEKTQNCLNDNVNFKENVLCKKSPSNHTTANASLMQAIKKCAYQQISQLLESSLDQISSKTLERAVLLVTAEGNKHILQLLITKGADVNCYDRKGFTGLMVAAEHSYLDMVKLLVNYGANVNMRTKTGVTALMLAAEKACSLPVLEFLLSKRCCADINIQDDDGRTALMISTQRGDVMAMRLFIYHKATELDLKNALGNTAQDLAKQSGVYTEYSALCECKHNDLLNPIIKCTMQGNLLSLKEFLNDDYFNLEQTNVNGHTPLIVALNNLSNSSAKSSAFMNIAEALIKRGADVNHMSCGEPEITPLLCAVESGQLQAVQLLVEHGASINFKTPIDGKTPLLAAAKEGYLDILAFLLQKGADFRPKDSFGRTALMRSLEEGAINCADLLIQNGADLDSEDILEASDLVRDPDMLLLFPAVVRKIAASRMCLDVLKFCISKKYYKLLELFFEQGTDVRRYCNDLLEFSEGQDVHITNLLLDKGADVNQMDRQGFTSLMRAVCRNDAKCVQLLIDRRADMNIGREGKTALMLAMEKRAVESFNVLLLSGVDVNFSAAHQMCADVNFRPAPRIFGCLIPLQESIKLKADGTYFTEQLIQHGANINAEDEVGQTALCLAIKLSHYDAVFLLLQNRAMVNVQSCTNTSIPLHVAVTHQDAKIVELLIKYGAGVNAKDHHHKTALMIASQVCKKGVVYLLLNSGAVVNAVDRNGCTALHYAIQHSILLTDKAEMLLRHGADINKANHLGETPFMLAVQFCKLNVLSFLVDNNADINAQDLSRSTALMRILDGRCSEFHHGEDTKGSVVTSLFYDLCGSTALRRTLDGRFSEFRYGVYTMGSVVTSLSYGRKMEVVEFLIQIGADVNIQNHGGNTALMLAAQSCSLSALKFLAGAESQAQSAAYSQSNSWAIILNRYTTNKQCYSKECPEMLNYLACLTVLVEAGLRPPTSDRICVLALYKGIICNHWKMVQLLVSKGVPPLPLTSNNGAIHSFGPPNEFFHFACGIPYQYLLSDDFISRQSLIAHHRSPLSMAIFCSNAALCRFFIDNWYFNENDKNRNYQKILTAIGGASLTKACEDILVQPWPLAVLSFITVSMCVGTGDSRQNRVRALPIPHILQDKLLYTSSTDFLVESSLNQEVLDFSVLPVHDPR